MLEIFIIISFLLFIGGAICSTFKESWKYILIPLALLVISVCTFIVMVSYRYSMGYDETIQTSEYKLVSLQDESQISGEMKRALIYVYASIDTNEVYTFYYETEDGGFKKGEINADNAVVYEKADCTPVIAEYTTYTKSKMSEKWQKLLLRDVLNEKGEKSYKIYIPKGTITREYNLDAQ